MTKKIRKFNKKPGKDYSGQILKLLSQNSSKDFNYKQIAAVLEVTDTKGRNEIIKELLVLKKAGKIDEANKVLEQRRARFQKALPYAEKLYANDPNNKEVVSLLKGMYMTTQNTAKYNEFKAKETAMK